MSVLVKLFQIFIEVFIEDNLLGERFELEATARAIAIALAGSFSGGESTHLSSGFL